MKKAIITFSYTDDYNASMLWENADPANIFKVEVDIPDDFNHSKLDHIHIIHSNERGDYSIPSNSRHFVPRTSYCFPYHGPKCPKCNAALDEDETS